MKTDEVVVALVVGMIFIWLFAFAMDLRVDRLEKKVVGLEVIVQYVRG